MVTPAGLQERSLASTKQDLISLADCSEPRWYAAYTNANHEKRVTDQLANLGIGHFLPQYESLRRWKDRRVRLQLPLFPGYVFVHLALRDRLQVMQVPGVVWLVGFGGHPAAVPEDEVARIREFLNRGFRAEPHPYLRVGRRMRVARGPLKGMEGIVVRRKNRTKLIISLDLIQRSVAVEIETADLTA